MASRSRVFWSFGSQVMSSATSILLSLLAAGRLSAIDFGLFAFAFAGSTLLVGSVRAFGAEILLFDSSEIENAEKRLRVRGALAFTISATIVSAGLVAIFGAFSGQQPVTLALLALAVCLPIIHDFGRYALVAQGAGRKAIAIEVPALVLVAAALFASADVPAADWVYGAWAVSEMLAVALTLAIFRRYLASPIRACATWLRSSGRLGAHYAADFWLTNGLTSGGVFIVGAIAGPAAAGAIRAAQVLLTPTLLLTRALALALAPELTRASDRGNWRLVRVTTGALAGGAVLMSILTLILAALLPRWILEAALGASTSAALAVLPSAAVALSLSGIAIAAGIGLRSRGMIRYAVRSKAITFPVAATGLALGAFVGGAAGSQFGLAIGEAVRGLLNWTKFLSSRESR